MNHSGSKSFTESDQFFMRRALDLAHQGRFSVSPNPRVGCVIVKTDTNSADASPRIIGEGFHQKRGFPHAERIALQNCVENPQNATLYVNLEPCCHTGLTPPCTDAVISAGIRRVVAAVLDPFPPVAGKGIAVLQEHGIQVEVGLLETEARYENRFFFHFHQKGLPWVILKAAVSLDGKMATRTGDAYWITGEAARAHVHEIRAEADAILIGAGTVLTDDPLLTARPVLSETQPIKPPIRVVLDPYGRIPLTARIFTEIQTVPTWIFISKSLSASKVKEYEKVGARVEKIPLKKQKFDLRDVLQHLAWESLLSVMVEGGPRIHTSFLEAGLVNEMMIYIAPLLIGGSDAPTFYMGQGADTMKNAFRLERVDRTDLGEDTLIRGILPLRL